MKKPAAQDKALSLYLKSKGKITNKDLATKVKVNPITVGKWKKDGDWEAKLKEQDSASVPAKARKTPAKVETPKPAKTARKAPAKAEAPKPSPSRRSARGPRALRKPEVFNKALTMFVESGGKITNTVLAEATGVTLATVAKWKKMPQWVVADLPQAAVKETTPSPVVEPSVAPVTTVDLRRVLENLSGLNQTIEHQIMSLVETKAQVLLGIQQCQMVLKQMKGE